MFITVCADLRCWIFLPTLDVFWRYEVNYSHFGSKSYDSKHAEFLNTASGFIACNRIYNVIYFSYLLHVFLTQRITIPEILEDEWFKKDYKPPVFDEKKDANLDDVEAVFKDSEVSIVEYGTNFALTSEERIDWCMKLSSLGSLFLAQSRNIM